MSALNAVPGRAVRRPTTWRPPAWFLAVSTLTLGIVVPALAYSLVGSVMPSSVSDLQDLIAGAYLLTAIMTLLEARSSLGSRAEPPLAGLHDPWELAELPTLSVIVSAYLPNEQELVVETIVNLATNLRVAAGRLQIILAYNTPEDLPVEAMLTSLADLNVAFTAVRVPESRSKAENINAALTLVTGEVTLLLDADHHPAPDAAVRALRWFSEGYDIVQGRCVIRDADTGWLSRLVAVEFEEMYGVAHAGRSLAFDTAMFCGTNGWWRTTVLRRIGMDTQMLTEDIDSSLRAMLAGYRTIHDRSVLSTELPPPSLKSWWNQRIRWAQGWFQVTLRHGRAIRKSGVLSNELKVYWTYLLGWRQLFPLLSLQILALLLADAILDRHLMWFSNPFLLATTVLTLVAGPAIGIATYKVALDETRREQRGWFLIYAATSLLYTTAKNTVAMVAAVRELIGQRSWVVTRRSVSSSALVAVALVPLLTAALTAAPARAATEGPLPISLAQTAPSLTLIGRAPVETIDIPIPSGWTSLNGTLRLRWQGSPAMAPDSSLYVMVGGTIADASVVGPTVGGATIPIHAADLSGHQLTIELVGQFHSTVVDGTEDLANDAVLALSPASSLTLTGVRADSPPLLIDLPEALVDRIGATVEPLYLSLPAQPTGAEIEAADLAAGAVDRSAGTSVPVRVVLGAPPQSLAGVNGEVISEVPSGSPELAVSRRPDGRLLVTLRGTGTNIVAAASALAQTKRPFYPGSVVTVPAGLRAVSTVPSASSAPLSASAGEGTGPLSVTSLFRLPVSRELDERSADITLGIGYDAPAGGRIQVLLNGLPVRAVNVRSQGASQLRLNIGVVQDPAEATSSTSVMPLSAEDNVVAPLSAGDNSITLEADLPPGQPQGVLGNAEAPSASVLSWSRVSFVSHPRTGQVTLGTWPWPFLTPGSGRPATVILPASLTPGQLDAVIGTVATASLWDQTPIDPPVVVNPTVLPHGNVMVFVSGFQAPPGLPTGAPARPQAGLLETYRSGGRQLLVAFGASALAPLTSGYEVNKLTGLAAVATPSGMQTIVAAHPAEAFPARPVPWKFPALVIVLGMVTLVVLRVRRARQRLDDLPEPEPSPPGDPIADLAHSVSAREQAELWEQLVAHESGDGLHER